MSVLCVVFEYFLLLQLRGNIPLELLAPCIFMSSSKRFSEVIWNHHWPGEWSVCFRATRLQWSSQVKSVALLQESMVSMSMLLETTQTVSTITY